MTLRRLLKHNAGVTVHGFPGYNRKEPLPPTNDILNGQGNTSKVVVDTIPGTTSRYSGGGYTIVEKVIEKLVEVPKVVEV